MLETFSMFGFLITVLTTVYLYFNLKSTKKELLKKEKAFSQQLFELTILKEISDKIGYTISIKDVAMTLASTIEKLFKVSSVSFAIIEQGHLEVTNLTKEKVGPKYLTEIIQILLQAVYEVDDSLEKFPVTEKNSGAHIDKENEPLLNGLIDYDAIPQSYFNIPLVLNNRFIGIINIAASRAHAYKDEDMSLLYKIINQAQVAIERLENVVEKEKGKVEALIKSLSSGAMFFTTDSGSLRLFTINSAAKRFLDLEGEVDLIQVLGKFELKPNLISEMKEVILMKKSTFYRDITINNMHFNIYVTPVFAPNDNTIIGVALTMQDITVEIEVDKTREGFVNMVVHELRAPLTAMKGASSLLLGQKLQPEDELKLKHIVHDSTERILNDINELLDSAKIDVGKMTIEPQTGDINKIVDKLVETFTYEAQNRGILIVKHEDIHVPAFAFDPVRIEQVLGNLVSNGIKFGNRGGKVEISTRVNHDQVEIKVKDDGIGIEEDKIKSLFQPFTQVTSIHRRRGTGLGLYISKAIIESHGGKISIQSKLGEGTAVMFSLPLITIASDIVEEQHERLVN